MIWLENIWAWLVANKDEIVVTVTTLATSGTFAALFAFIHNIKMTKETNKLSKNLETSLGDVNSLSTEYGKLKAANDDLTKELSITNNRINELTDEVDMLLSKVDAMLDVQSLVYSTTKNDKIREAVMSIISNAKYIKTAQRDQLLKELEQLKNKFAEATKNNQKQLEDSVNKAQAIISASDKNVAETTLHEEVLRS